MCWLIHGILSEAKKMPSIIQILDMVYLIIAKRFAKKYCLFSAFFYRVSLEGNKRHILWKLRYHVGTYHMILDRGSEF